MNMKNISTIGLLFGSIFFVSCSSNTDVLSNFSKRKYLKNFKESKKSYDASLEEKSAQLNTIDSKSVNSLSVEETPNTLAIPENSFPKIAVSNFETSKVYTPIEKQLKSVRKEFRNWDKFNNLNEQEFLVSKEQNINFNTLKNSSSAEVNTVVLAILAIFIPPLAVYLFDDAVTANFWVDLLLWFLFIIPGIVFAFLVIFADVSL